MEKIIERILDGDPQAVNLFYKHYSPKISKYLTYRLPSEKDAEEITNDVFLEAIDSLNLIQNPTKLESWLYKIAHNKMVDFYRKRKIKSILLSQVPYLQIVAGEILEPEFQFEKKRIKEKIENTFFNLSNKHQEILKLHYVENIPVKDLTTILKLSFKATESLLFRARKQFQLEYGRS